MWSKPEPESTNGIIRHYEVTVSALQNSRRGQTFTTVETELTVMMLLPYSDYECSVAAVTVERGPFSTPVQAQTFQDGKFHM